eukprot:TRINITY_DN11717_c0_g1_i1.p1 TRINITY_DN11717_c0_g1~~TRINITY_DN11717_c0_g1_i1.p1  ORF type:complete len:305 (+),score=87.15 TRINITY_DN11717_c0_g1_i1:78-992(+)
MYLIGVCGASASGKTTLCQEVHKAMGRFTTKVGIVAMDSFYKTPSPEELADITNYNFDHPNAFDFPAIEKCFRQLQNQGEAQIPKYSFETHSRLQDTELIAGEVVFFEGILTLHDERVRELLDLTIFVDCDLDTCLVRRIRRDMRERGRSVDNILQQYEKTVKPMFETFIQPLKKYADIIVPRGGGNRKAVRIVTEHIKHQLLSQGKSGVFSLSPFIGPSTPPGPSPRKRPRERAYGITSLSADRDAGAGSPGGSPTGAEAAAKRARSEDCSGSAGDLAGDQLSLGPSRAAAFRAAREQPEQQS